ncbi:Proline-rich protein [Labilithrix luteola]|uniref:Proline-rich protein n=1 Tax=Labilithrix luteola TaxID=1391654 RepID=A0A0K1PR96_9BACT|nr:hypothetical protein [Labilithrix luteola]AKU96065.1 Proline-rich protein [Labilithrix luteola]
MVDRLDERDQRDDDSSLDGAFRALRDRYDGTHAQSDATLRRVLLGTRKQQQSRKVTRWAILPIAATLVASTAWAGATGKLAVAYHAMSEMLHSSETSETSPSKPVPNTPQNARAPMPAATQEPAPASAEPEPTPEPEAPKPVESANAPISEQVPAPAAPAKVAPAPRESAHPATTALAAPTPPPAETTPTARTNEPSKPSTASSTAEPSDPNAALFAEAHRVHFVERDAARALTAWDAYLAADPNGRFVPEARYNRAIALIRLGRSAEAQNVLQSFAAGNFGDYHRSDARQLLDALKRDE